MATKMSADEREYLEKEVTMAHNELSTAALSISTFEAQTNPTGKSKRDTKGSLEWSKEAAKLARLVADELRLGRKTNLYTEEFLRGFFKSLQLKKMRISRIDPLCVQFSKLEELNLSQNKISILENLPSSLRVLNAYANQLTHVGLNRVFPNLVYAGLGYNQLASVTQLNSLATCFPRLRILELSFNTICDLEGVLDCLSRLRQLSHLSLVGNPVTLLKDYRSHTVRALPNLEELDDLDTEAHFSLIQVTPSDTVPSKVVLRFQVQNLSCDDGNNDGKKKKGKAKRKAKVKTKAADKKKGAKASKGKGKGKKGAKTKKAGKAKKGHKDMDEEEEPEPQTLFFIRFEAPGVEGGVGQTPATPVEEDGSCTFAHAVALELPPTPELRDCIYFEGITVSMWSQRSTPAPVTPDPDPTSDESDDDAPAPEPAPPIVTDPKFEGQFVLKVADFLSPKWTFKRLTAEPNAEVEDATVSPHPIFLQERTRLCRPAAREQAPEVSEGEEPPPLDGAPPGPIFITLRVQMGQVEQVKEVIEEVKDDE